MADFDEAYEMTHISHVRNTWTLGTVLAATLSAASLLSMLGGGIWFAARLDNATRNIPQIVEMERVISETEKTDALQIAVLQDQQKYTDMRYAEIMAELEKINQKLDDRSRDK